VKCDIDSGDLGIVGRMWWVKFRKVC